MSYGAGPIGGGGDLNLRSRGGGAGGQNAGGYTISGGGMASGYPQQQPAYQQAPMPGQQTQQQQPAASQPMYGSGSGGYPQPLMQSNPMPSYAAQFPSQQAPQQPLHQAAQQHSPPQAFQPSMQPSRVSGQPPLSAPSFYHQPVAQSQPAFPQPQQPSYAHAPAHAGGDVVGFVVDEQGTPNDNNSYGVRRTGTSQRASPPLGGQGDARGAGYGANSRLSPSHAAYRDGEPGGAASGGFFPASVAAPDDRLRRKQNTDSLNNYIIFMYALVALSLFVMGVAWFTLGSAAKYVCLVLSICIASFVFTLKLTQWIFSKDDGNPAMRVISEAIREGSEGFLRVQYGAISTIALIIAVVIGVIYLFRESPSSQISPQMLAVVTAISYIIGAFCSGLAGYIGVWVSIRVNIRVAVAASKYSFKDALLLSFRGGAVSACLSASLCILGVTILYVFCHLFFCTWGSLPSKHVPMLLVGYGFGGALVALFMQLGGGIYTKAADVGADMIGKVEAGIPEDDPRNPAVIADLVGDNVGDCAGSMADVFESIAAEVIGTMILGAALAHEAKLVDPEPWIFFPLIIHALDLIISSIGIMLTSPRSDKEDPLATMTRAYGICMGLAAVGFAGTCRFLLYTPVAPSAWWNYTLCGWIGIGMSFAIIRSTQHYTDAAYSPVKRIAAASQTGHGTNVIAGISVGLESTCVPTVVIASALLAAFTLGKTSGLPGLSAGVFGTAVATMGMLCTAVFVLSMNNFGPIADNAGGIVEMSGQPHEVRVITDKLDSVGNVTKAASKGYAVGGSALSCFVLFQAFLDEISAYSGVPFLSVNIAKVEVVCGGLLGMMMIFLFAGWAMQSVGNTAQKVVWEVRRQFKNKPGIMDGTDKPDYDACVAIVTREALKEMVWPALLALLLPVAVGFGFKYFGAMTGRPQLGVEVVAGFMMFGTLAGLLMAMFMDNAGGAWDNAKKLIESQGAKGSEAHKAAVTGDTVGDPFKDTAGPALHVIITTMSTTILVMGPLFAGATGQA